MDVKRWAGDAMGHLMDNAMTQSWQKTMDRYVSAPVGRRMASDLDLKQGVGEMLVMLPGAGAGVQPLHVELLNRYAGRNDITAEMIAADAAEDIASGSSKDVAEFVARQMMAAVSAKRVSRETQEATAAQLARLHGGTKGLTETGTAVRQFGGPIGAYATVGGGAALAVKGALDVIARMQAGEEVGENEVAAAIDVVESVGGGLRK